MVPMDLAHFYHPWFQWSLKCAFDRGMSYSVAQGPGPGYLIFVFVSEVSQGNAPCHKKLQVGHTNAFSLSHSCCHSTNTRISSYFPGGCHKTEAQHVSFGQQSPSTFVYVQECHMAHHTLCGLNTGHRKRLHA